MKIKIYLFIGLCLGATGLAGQTRIYTPGTEILFEPSSCTINSDCDDLDPFTYDYCGANGCYHSHSTGWPFGHSHSFAFDANGKLWVNQGSKVSAFDGMNYEYYSSINSNLDFNNYAFGAYYHCLVDANGNPWMSGRHENYEQGVGTFDGGEWAFYTPSNSTLQQSELIRDMVAGDNGEVWFLHTDHMLSHFDGTSWTSYDLVALFGVTGFNTHLDIGPGGDLWICYKDTDISLIQYDGTSWTQYTTPLSITPYDYVRDVNGLNWFTSANGIWTYSGGTTTLFMPTSLGLPSDYVQRIYEFSPTEMWFSSWYGSLHYDGSTYEWFNTSNSGVHANHAKDIEKHPITGDIYILHDSTIMSIYDGTSWSTTEPDENSFQESFYIPYIAPNGDVYFFGQFQQYQTSVIKYSNGGWSPVSVLGWGKIAAAHQSNGTIWFCGFGTSPLTSYDGTTYTEYDYTNTSLPVNIHFSDIIIDANDEIWLSSYNEGVWHYDGTTWTGYNSANSGFPSDFCGAINISENTGHIWVSNSPSSLVGHIWAFDGTSWSAQISDIDLMYPQSSLVLGANDEVWIGTFNGALYHDGIDSIVYDTMTLDPIYDPFITDIIKDPYGNIWAASNFSYMWRFDGNQWQLWGEDKLHIWPDSLQGMAFMPDGTAWYASNSAAVFLTVADSVWPGDADNNGIAANLDLLAVGQAFGAVGSARPNASLSWVGQPSTFWGPTLNSPAGIDYMFTDTDGSGTVDLDDTLAISLNFGLTHSRTGDPESGDVPLILMPDKTNTQPGDTVHTIISLGTDSIPADSVYGLAFTLNYDPSLVDSGSIHISFSNSWLGTKNQDMISLGLDFYDDGKIPMAICRTDQNNQSGFGQIASFSLVMIDDISGKGQLVDTLQLEITDVHLIRYDGSIILTGVEGAEIEIVQEVSDAIDPDFARFWNIYPNPADQQLIIQNTATFQPSTQVQIFNLNGQVMHTVSLRASSTSISTADLPDGLYGLLIQQNDKICYKKIQIIH